ncbi:MAG: class I tRNA ligase family protein, partial [Candidatus Sifarchaeia archaeon]
APMIPHLCEEFWSKMKRNGFVSFADWPVADKKLIDKSTELAFHVVDSTVRDIREIKKLLRGKKAEKVHIYVAPQWTFDAMNGIREADLPLVVGEIMKHLMSNPDFRKHGKAVKNIVDRIAKENGLWDHSKSAKDEATALRDSTRYVESEVGMKVYVHDSANADYDPDNKARFALPGRVSLYLE